MLAAVVAAVVLGWLLVRLAEGGSTQITAGGAPVRTSAADLVKLSDELNEPIYWAGAVPGKTLEATVATSHSVFVRYLPPSVSVDDSSSHFLTVGTYPDPNAYYDLRHYARQNHAVTRSVTDGGLAVMVPHSPRSVYVAYPHGTVQVEVYDQHRGHALSLIRSGTITPVQ